MESASQNASSQRWVLYVALPVLVALSGLFKVSDLDVWWRVKTGEWIWQHGSIPDTDPFSHTALGPWNCVEAGGNLFLYAFEAALGQSGLAWAGAVMLLAVALALVALAKYVTEEGPSIGPIFLAVGLFASVSNFRFGPKPELFTLCGLAILLLVLHIAEQERKWKILLSIPALVLVWACLHRGASVSVPVFGAAMVVWIIRPETRRLGAVAAGVLALTVAALLITPGTADALRSSAAVVSDSVYVEHIAEWRPLSFEAMTATMPLLPVLFAIWLFVAPVQRRLHFGTLIVLGLGFMALRHSRFVPLFALAMVPEVAWGLRRVLSHHRVAIDLRVRPAVLRAVMIASGLGAMGMAYMSRPVATWGPGVHHKLRPSGAARFLATYPPPGRMFNTFNYGSYLLYALGPEQKVFIDGRNDQVFSPDFFAKAAATPGNDRILAELVAAYDIGYAVLQCTRLINYSYLWLYQHPDWRLVYLDDNTAVLVKRTRESAEYLERHAFHELSPSSSYERAFRYESDPRHQEFALEVLRNLEQSPQSIRAHFLAAWIHRAAGRQDRYLYERERVRQMAADRRLNIQLP